jgi:hypothetical protein
MSKRNGNWPKLARTSSRGVRRPIVGYLSGASHVSKADVVGPTGRIETHRPSQLSP